MTLPASPYCRVRARVASIWADGPDDGTHPDWRPAVGERVILMPSIGSQLLTYDVAGSEPVIVTVEHVQCVVDADGWLAKADGRPVYIAPTDDPLLSATGWTWTANIRGKSIVFSAPSSGVVDLALFIATPAVDAVEYVSVVQIVADYIAANPSDLAEALEPVVADYLTANPPPAGDDGREVELQTSATHVQWRYDGDATWLDLIPLSIITGQDGDDGLSAELQTTATHIQWRQAGGAWADLIPLASLVGPVGPPNTLTIGTVTTLTAGAPATAAITGAAPNQTLGLGIPMGLTGAASDWLKVGPGDPRTPSTTAGQITGTEPNGCSYRSTDGGGVGGYRWVKRASVWVCVEGDTGWKTVYNATADPATWAGGTIDACRINDQVFLRFNSLACTAGSGAALAADCLPSWAAPLSAGTRSASGLLRANEGSPHLQVHVYGDDIRYTGPVGTASTSFTRSTVSLRGQLSYLPDVSAWPTSV